MARTLAAEDEGARVAAEETLHKSVDVSVAESVPTRGPVHMDSDALDVVRSVLQHNVGEPEGGYFNGATTLVEQLHGPVADSVRRAHWTGARESGP